MITPERARELWETRGIACKILYTPEDDKAIKAVWNRMPFGTARRIDALFAIANCPYPIPEPESATVQSWQAEIATAVVLFGEHAIKVRSSPDMALVVDWAQLPDELRPVFLAAVCDNMERLHSHLKPQKSLTMQGKVKSNQ